MKIINKFVVVGCLLLTQLSAQAQIVSGPISKITGPNGASVDTASGVSINPGAGGSVNVVSGDTYVPTRIDFSTTVSPTLTAAGHAAIAYDGTNLLLSKNGGAYATLGGADTATANVFTAKQTFRLTTNQAEFGYDSSNYLRITVDSTGNSTLATTGTNPRIILTPGGTGSVRLAAGSSTAPALDFGSANSGFYSESVGNGISVVNSGTFSMRFLQAQLDFPSNGLVTWGNNVNAIGTADIAIKRSAVGVVEVNNGSGGTYRDLLARGLRSNAVTFSNAIGSPVEGTIQAFTDSTTNTWGATITGGGSNHVLGYYNGTNWTVLGK